MDGLGNQLFSHPGFTCDQYRLTGTFQGFNHLEYGHHSIAAGDNVTEFPGIGKRFSQKVFGKLAIADYKIAAFDGILNDRYQPRRIKRLGYVVVCPLLDAAHDIVEITHTGHDDDRYARIVPNYFREKGGARRFRHDPIEQQNGMGSGCESLKNPGAFLQGGNISDAVGEKGTTRPIKKLGIVINDKYGMLRLILSGLRHI